MGVISFFSGGRNWDFFKAEAVPPSEARLGGVFLDLIYFCNILRK